MTERLMKQTTAKPPEKLARIKWSRVDRALPPGPELSLAVVTKQSVERRALELRLQQKFERSYGAQLTHFLPSLVRLHRCGELGAVVGVRAASESALFLEQYTDRRIEQFIAGAYKTPVDRDQVVEIGNLAAVVPGLAYTLFAILATLLNEAGFRWVACTATPQVEAMLARMQFSSRTICSADPTRLIEGSANWGNYYASRPNVIVGSVRDAAAVVKNNPDAAIRVGEFAESIPYLSSSLNTARS